MASEPIYIVDEIGRMVAAVATKLNMSINYQYGPPLEIIQTLAEAVNSTDMSQRAGNFPLVMLWQDFEEEKGRDTGIYADVSLTMIIAKDTDPNYKAMQRYETNFKPVLYPIYYELLHQIDIAKYTNGRKSTEQKSDDEIKHKKIDHVFWGKQGAYGSSANPFNDYLDAIELKNLKLTFLNKDF